LRAGFGLDGGAGFGLAVDAGGEPVGALAFHRTIYGSRTYDTVTAAVQRDRAGPLDIAVDVAIGVDPETQHAPMHATDFFVDGGEAPRDLAFDSGGQRRQAEFDGDVTLDNPTRHI